MQPFRARGSLQLANDRLGSKKQGKKRQPREQRRTSDGQEKEQGGGQRAAGLRCMLAVICHVYPTRRMSQRSIRHRRRCFFSVLLSIYRSIQRASTSYAAR